MHEYVNQISPIVATSQKRQIVGNSTQWFRLDSRRECDLYEGKNEK